MNSPSKSELSGGQGKIRRIKMELYPSAISPEVMELRIDVHTTTNTFGETEIIRLIDNDFVPQFDLIWRFIKAKFDKILRDDIKQHEKE